MIDVIKAVSDLLTGTPAIVAKVAKYKLPNGTDSAFPLIVSGVIPEKQTGSPAINYFAGSPEALAFPGASKYRTTITVNCYGANQAEAISLALTVQEAVDYGIGSVGTDNQPLQTYCQIGPTVQSLDGDAYQTPVQLVIVQ